MDPMQLFLEIKRSEFEMRILHPIIKILKTKFSLKNDFDDSNLFQLKFWNTSLILSIISTLSFAIIFAFLAKIDEVVNARGEIQAIGAERPVKAKVTGIIDKVIIEEGDKVKKNQILISINTDSLKARKTSLLNEKLNLEKSLKLQKEIIKRSRKVYDEGAIPLLEILRLEKALLEINSNLERKKAEIRLNLINTKDSNVTSPMDGNVFELIPKNSGYYINAGETLLKIVPDGQLEAKIFVKNSDIGFVKEGMKAEIRVDAYPFSRFGSLSGSVLHIGDEVLPADNLNPQSRFPVYLNIENQYLMKNKNKYQIKAGQSINVNLIVKQRRVITIFTDIFSNSIDSLKSIKSIK